MCHAPLKLLTRVSLETLRAQAPRSSLYHSTKWQAQLYQPSVIYLVNGHLPSPPQRALELGG